MSQYYSHLLIPRQSDYIPTARQVQAFVSAMLAAGVIPGTPTLVLWTPSGKTREFQNPFADEMIVVELKESRPLKGTADLIEALAGLRDYEVEAAGVGRPRMPPIPLDFDGPYHVALTCIVSSSLRVTSDPHTRWGEFLKPGPMYGERCDRALDVGTFHDPSNGAVIEVAGAACAHFWLEFRLGKSLFPRIEDGNLDILHPEIVAEATRIFDVPFLQGCQWG